MSPLVPLHLLSLLYVAWNIIRADHIGLSWMRGVTPTLDEKKVSKYHKHVWIGLGLMIFTGFLLFMPMREYLLTKPQFYVKMAFVVTLICNGFVIGKLYKTATTRTYNSLTTKEKAPLFISAAISIVCWLGAGFGGLYLLEDF
mgnify:FL=1